jgi:hypothetical protein
VAFVAFLAALLAVPAAAAFPADRPSAADNAWTVGMMHLQLETGVELRVDEVAGADVLRLLLPTKLRFGVVESIELHLESDALVWQRTSPPAGGEAVSEVLGADLDFGAKIHAVDGAGWVPSVGLVVSVTAPTGSRQVTRNAWLVSPTFAVEWTLPLEIGLLLNAGFTAPLTRRATTDDVVRYALAIGRSFAPVAPWLAGFVQVFGETPLDGEDTVAMVGGGFTFRVHELVQLDIYANGGLSELAPTFAGGLGLTFRL